MIATYLLLLTTSVVQSEAHCPVHEGRYVLGFEASYLVPSRGEYKGRKIWIENSNKLATYLAASSKRNTAWKHADVRLKGCVKAGRFGALGAYKLSIGSFDVIDFTAK